jgi:hypothetical protein
MRRETRERADHRRPARPDHGLGREEEGRQPVLLRGVQQGLQRRQRQGRDLQQVRRARAERRPAVGAHEGRAHAERTRERQHGGAEAARRQRHRQAVRMGPLESRAIFRSDVTVVAHQGAIAINCQQPTRRHPDTHYASGLGA